MKARRVYADDGSSHIEPPLPDDASDLEKLNWQAEVASEDSGLDITIAEGGYFVDGIEQPGFYAVTIEYYSVAGPYTFHDAWTLMNGISTGARAVRQSL